MMRHRLRAVVFVALFISWCAIGAAVVAAAPYGKPANNRDPEIPPPPPPPVVIRFQNAQRGRIAGHDVLVVHGTAMLTGKSLQLPVPNEEWKNQYSPRPEMADLIKTLKPGD